MPIFCLASKVHHPAAVSKLGIPRTRIFTFLAALIFAGKLVSDKWVLCKETVVEDSKASSTVTRRLELLLKEKRHSSYKLRI